MKFQVLALLCVLFSLGFCQETHERWTKTAVPPNYWHPLGSHEESTYGTFFDCAFGCMMKDSTECHGFIFDKEISECTFGKLVPTFSNKFIPAYVMDGLKISIRGSIVNRRAVSVVHGHHLGDSASATNDASLSDTAMMSADLPRVPEVKTFHSVLFQLRDGVVACGGNDLVTNQDDRKCRQWSFLTQQWRLLPEGEMSHGHFLGAGAMLQGRMWVFGGKPSSADVPAHAKVESYDAEGGLGEGWREEADAAAVAAGLMQHTAVGLELTAKILLVGGRDTPNVVLFDPADGSYRKVGDLGQANSIGVACGFRPGHPELLICAGGSDTLFQDTNRVHIFDVETETLLTHQSFNDLPFATFGSFLPVGADLLFAANADSKVYKYNHGDANAWEEVPGAQLAVEYPQRNFVYTIDYHELLV